LVTWVVRRIGEVGGEADSDLGGEKWVPNCFLGRVLPLTAVKVVPECISGPRKWPHLDDGSAGDRLGVTRRGWRGTRDRVGVTACG
jgi:hypothetical protein